MPINFPSDLRLVKVLDGETCSDFHRNKIFLAPIYGETSMRYLFSKGMIHGEVSTLGGCHDLFKGAKGRWTCYSK